MCFKKNIHPRLKALDHGGSLLHPTREELHQGRQGDQV